MGKGLKVLVAAVAGFAAGILLAPKSGKETRNDIKNKTDEAKTFAGEKLTQAKSAGKDVVKTVKKGAETVGDEAADLAKSARSSAEVVAKEANKLANEAKSGAKNAAEEVKSAAKTAVDDVKRNVR